MDMPDVYKYLTSSYLELLKNINNKEYIKKVCMPQLSDKFINGLDYIKENGVEIFHL